MSVTPRTIFAACQKFGPECGEKWSSYLLWSGFHHLKEIVSADSILCPELIEKLIEEDWNFNIHADYRVTYFHDWKYLKQRISYDDTRHNLLALTESPMEEIQLPSEFKPSCFYILDSFDSISVLLNCGAFPGIYSTSDLNELGLIPDLERATEIAKQIRETNPDDDHCQNCRVWGVARYQNER